MACKLAADHPDEIAGLVLTTPFPSLADVASRHYPFVPVRLILRDRWDNVSALEEYRGPVAVLVAERDEIVPADLGRALYESYQGPKRLWSQDGARHNTIDYREGSPWWEELTDFLLEGERSGAR